jgi:hypothetical protein
LHPGKLVRLLSGLQHHFLRSSCPRIQGTGCHTVWRSALKTRQDSLNKQTALWFYLALFLRKIVSCGLDLRLVSQKNLFGEAALPVHIAGSAAFN